MRHAAFFVRLCDDGGATHVQDIPIQSIPTVYPCTNTTSSVAPRHLPLKGKAWNGPFPQRIGDIIGDVFATF